MASSFNTTLGALEDELMTLILEGKIQARIDSHNKVCLLKPLDSQCGNCGNLLSSIFSQKSVAVFTKYFQVRANFSVFYALRLEV